MKKTLFLVSLLVAAISATQVYAGTAITVTSGNITLTKEQLQSGTSGFDLVTSWADGIATVTGGEVNYATLRFTVNASALSGTTADTNIIYVTNAHTWGIMAREDGKLTGAWKQDGGSLAPVYWDNTKNQTKEYSEVSGYAVDGSIAFNAQINGSGTVLKATAANGLAEKTVLNPSGLQAGAPTALKLNTNYVDSYTYSGVQSVSYTDAQGVTHTVTSGAYNRLSDTDVQATLIHGGRFSIGNETDANKLSQHGGDILIGTSGAQLYVSRGTVSNHIYVGGTDYRDEGEYSGDIRLEGGATISGTITLLADSHFASASSGGTFSGAIEGASKVLTISQGHNAGTLNFTGNVMLGEMVSANAVAFNNATGTFTVDKLNNSNASTVAANTTLTIKELAGTGAVTNNGIINLAVNAESTAYVRTKNGYNGTIQKVITLGGTGALSGNGTWKVDNIKATLDGRTLTAVDFNETKYYVDKSNETYDSSLAGKYVVSAGMELTVDRQTNGIINIAENNGTIVLSGASGYFASKKQIGNIELSGSSALTLTDGYSYHQGYTTYLGSISGTGTIKTSGNKSPKERIEVSGDVEDSVSFIGNRTSSASSVTFAFTKEGVETVTLAEITNTTGTLNFEAKALTTTSLTLNAGTVGVYSIGSQLSSDSSHSAADEVSLTTTNLTVGGNATLNADLVVNGGTMTFANNAILTMGSKVSIGDDVTVVLTQEMVDSIYRGEWVEIIASVDGVATLGNTSFTGATGVTLDQPKAYALTQIDDKVYITPEPATATLSLLALAALASRRKRH